MALRDEILAGSKKLNTDIFALNPSAVISLFIIDFTDIAFDLGISNQQDTVFRFHNNLKLTINDILFNTDKAFDPVTGEDILDRYVAAPIRAEGFEYSGRGTLPTPKLSLTVQEENLTLMTSLKRQIYAMNDLSGAKVTRIRTLAKYLHPNNFLAGDAPENNAHDRYAEFQREIFYIDRKSAENKSYLEFELASALDLHNIKLPGRIVSSTRCVWQYRGCGCMYEQEYRTNSQTIETIHGIYNGHSTIQTFLPDFAPPVATENDELISEIIGIGQGDIKILGKYDSTQTYTKGDAVFLDKGGVKYYYVCKNATATTAPPSSTDWVADRCSKTIRGCKFRWGPNGQAVYGTPATEAGYSRDYLSFGGFPATQRA